MYCGSYFGPVTIYDGGEGGGEVGWGRSLFAKRLMHRVRQLLQPTDQETNPKFNEYLRIASFT